MRDSISAYLEYCSSRRYSPETIASYQRRLKQFRMFTHSNNVRKIKDVTIEMIRDFQEQLIDNRLKPATIKAYMVTISTFLHWCYNHRLILSDIASRIELPRKTFTLPPKPLTESNMKELFQSIPTEGISNLRNKAIVEVMYACGLRRQELVELKIRDIDASKGIVRVRGKGDKERVVPIHERAIKSISDYLVQRDDKLKQDSSLFLTHSNRCKESHKMTSTALGKVFVKLNRNFPKHLHAHLLRHTFALHMLQNGVNLRYVQQLLGHESPDTTSRYLGYCKDEIKRLYDSAIGDILDDE